MEGASLADRRFIVRISTPRLREMLHSLFCHWFKPRLRSRAWGNPEILRG